MEGRRQQRKAATAALGIIGSMSADSSTNNALMLPTASPAPQQASVLKLGSGITNLRTAPLTEASPSMANQILKPATKSTSGASTHAAIDNILSECSKALVRDSHDTNTKIGQVFARYSVQVNEGKQKQEIVTALQLQNSEPAKKKKKPKTPSSIK
jgi:hypothetical protein